MKENTIKRRTFQIETDKTFDEASVILETLQHEIYRARETEIVNHELSK